MTILTEIDLDAPVLANHEIGMDAPLAIAWNLLIDVNSWKYWNPEITFARLDGEFVTGASFEWESYEFPVTSTIYQVDLHRRVLWGGIANGVTARHEWLFTKSNDGVHVQTRESFAGAPVDADEAGMQTMLDQSLSTWLGRIKDAALSKSGTDAGLGAHRN